MKKETSNATRKQIVDAHLRGNDNKQISEVLNLKQTTIHEIIKVYTREGRIDKKLRGGERNKKINEVETERIQEWIDEDCSITLARIKERLFEEFNLTVSVQTISKCISNFNYSFKRTQIHPARRNDEASLNARQTYANLFIRYLTATEEQTFVFIDEVGFCATMRSKYGRSQIGTSPIHVPATIRSRNVSVCCAITKEKALLFKAQTTAFNTGFFKDFLIELFQVFEHQGVQRATLILDNVAFHKSQQIQGLFENMPHELLFLPPYSPFLNPIENWFSKWKQYVRQQRPANEENLLLLIERGLETLTRSDCNNYFRHMLSYLPRCQAREPISD